MPAHVDKLGSLVGTKSSISLTAIKNAGCKWDPGSFGLSFLIIEDYFLSSRVRTIFHVATLQYMNVWQPHSTYIPTNDQIRAKVSIQVPN